MLFAYIEVSCSCVCSLECRALKTKCSVESSVGNYGCFHFHIIVSSARSVVQNVHMLVNDGFNSVLEIFSVDPLREKLSCPCQLLILYFQCYRQFRSYIDYGT